MTIGYARVSTAGQNLDGQCDNLRQAGCERIYSEKTSGVKAQRPELERMLDALREGDTVVITELTRLGRSVKELFAFTIFAGLSQFERDLIRQRTKSGLEAARARGRKGGRPKASSGKVETALKMYDSKLHTIEEITIATGISRSTLYRAIEERKKNKSINN